MEFIITHKKLKDIASNFVLTDHARDRIVERLGEKTHEELTQMITNSYLAWRNVDNCINIAISPNQYFVMQQAHTNNKYVIITLKEESRNGITADTKFQMAFFNEGNFICKKKKKQQ